MDFLSITTTFIYYTSIMLKFFADAIVFLAASALTATREYVLDTVEACYVIFQEATPLVTSSTVWSFTILRSFLLRAISFVSWAAVFGGKQIVKIAASQPPPSALLTLVCTAPTERLSALWNLARLRRVAGGLASLFRLISSLGLGILHFLVPRKLMRSRNRNRSRRRARRMASRKMTHSRHKFNDPYLEVKAVAFLHLPYPRREDVDNEFWLQHFPILFRDFGGSWQNSSVNLSYPPSPIADLSARHHCRDGCRCTMGRVSAGDATGTEAASVLSLPLSVLGESGSSSLEYSRVPATPTKDGDDQAGILSSPATPFSFSAGSSVTESKWVALHRLVSEDRDKPLVVDILAKEDTHRIENDQVIDAMGKKEEVLVNESASNVVVGVEVANAGDGKGVDRQAAIGAHDQKIAKSGFRADHLVPWAKCVLDLNHGGHRSHYVVLRRTTTGAFPQTDGERATVIKRRNATQENPLKRLRSAARSLSARSLTKIKGALRRTRTEVSVVPDSKPGPEVAGLSSTVTRDAAGPISYASWEAELSRVSAECDFPSPSSWPWEVYVGIASFA